MPLYEYQCQQCNRRTEKIQKFSDAELTVCPHCGGALERTITAASVQFAGGGWYKDLYSSAKPAGASSSTSTDSSSTAAAPSTSAPAAPATAAAPAPAAAPAATPSKS
jgi:putative FmdB family regulatory protein